MQLFRRVRTFYKTLGVCSLPSNQTYLFNKKIFMIYLNIALVNIAGIEFLRHDATSVADYGKSFYGSVTQFGCLCGFITTIWQMRNILKLIEKYEAFVAKS